MVSTACRTSSVFAATGIILGLMVSRVWCFAMIAAILPYFFNLGASAAASLYGDAGSTMIGFTII